jgi:hypothetical protein
LDKIKVNVKDIYKKNVYLEIDLIFNYLNLIQVRMFCVFARRVLNHFTL